jgi:hypothetical protein
MNNRIFLIGGGVLLLLIIALAFSLITTNTKEETAHLTTDATPATTTVATPTLPDGKTNLQFELFSPIQGATIASPLNLTGRARGTWFFEASFPIELRDNDGALIASAIAQSQSDWMTEDFVDWSTTMTWGATSTTATSGVLVFKKDNPSGMPEHDASVKIPVLLQ